MKLRRKNWIRRIIWLDLMKYFKISIILISRTLGNEEERERSTWHRQLDNKNYHSLIFGLKFLVSSGFGRHEMKSVRRGRGGGGWKSKSEKYHVPPLFTLITWAPIYTSRNFPIFHLFPSNTIFHLHLIVAARAIANKSLLIIFQFA